MASATSGMASVAAVTMTIAVITPAAYPSRPAPGGAPTPPWQSPARRRGSVRRGPVRRGTPEAPATTAAVLTPRPRPRGPVRRRRGPSVGLGWLWDGLIGGVTESLCERSQQGLDTVVRPTGK